MNERLRKHVDGLFANAPATMKTVELKQEILLDKYGDLIAAGNSEESAFSLAVAGIGDVGPLLEALWRGASPGEPVPQHEVESARRRSALLVSLAVSLYILSVVPVLLLQSVAGVVLMFCCIAAATALLIYNNMSRPRTLRQDDSIVEEFREWKETNSEKGRQKKAVCSAIWGVAVPIYFLVSFLSGAWHITWVIFLIAGAACAIVRAAYDLKG